MNHPRGLDHALTLTARGWAGLPYLDRADGKQLPNWPNLATTDTEQILEWFGEGKPYENCYFGIVPGKVGKTVIDIDCHDDGIDGFQTLRDLRISDSTAVQGTSRSGKGRHLYFNGVSSSKRIYPGVDRKSLGGLIRVTYLLPDIEDVFVTLPEEFEINNSSVSGREFKGSTTSWFDRYSGRPASSKVLALKESTPSPFRGHTELLRIQTGLIKLAGEGAGGVPESLLELEQAWLHAEHSKGGLSPAVEWNRALAGGIAAFGGVPPEPTLETSSPDDFFEKSRLKPLTLAKAISYDLGLGQDEYVWVYKGGVWVPGYNEIQNRTLAALQDRFSSTHIRTMQVAVTGGCDLPRLTDVPNSDFINLKSGMYDWRNSECNPHDPKYFSTVQLNVNYTTPWESCPKFDAWLDEVVDKDVQPLLWEALGYALMSGNPYHRAILLLGPEGTGKSTFLRLLTALLGESNVSNMSLRALSEDEFARANLFGKTANICGDIDAKFLEDASMFKAITGGDTISAQHKFKNMFSFTPWAVPIFSANKVWRSGDDTGGYMRRWLVLPFPNQVDRSLNFDESALFDEASGIFNKAMEALRRLMKRGNFEPQGSAAAILEDFKVESDVIRLWLREDECIEVSERSRVNRTQLFNRYKFWCFENGYKHKGSSELFKSLRALGFEESKVNGTNYFKGITHKQPEQHPLL
jgi:putative DNA primase/helicase